LNFSTFCLWFLLLCLPFFLLRQKWGVLFLDRGFIFLTGQVIFVTEWPNGEFVSFIGYIMLTKSLLCKCVAETRTP